MIPFKQTLNTAWLLIIDVLPQLLSFSSFEADITVVLCEETHAHAHTRMGTHTCPLFPSTEGKRFEFTYTRSQTPSCRPASSVYCYPDPPAHPE